MVALGIPNFTRDLLSHKLVFRTSVPLSITSDPAHLPTLIPASRSRSTSMITTRHSYHVSTDPRSHSTYTQSRYPRCYQIKHVLISPKLCNTDPSYYYKETQYHIPHTKCSNFTVMCARQIVITPTYRHNATRKHCHFPLRFNQAIPSHGMTGHKPCRPTRSHTDGALPTSLSGSWMG